jgi:hypothetical protein
MQSSPSCRTHRRRGSTRRQNRRRHGPSSRRPHRSTQLQVATPASLNAAPKGQRWFPSPTMAGLGDQCDPSRTSQSIIRRVNAPLTIPSRNALKSARMRNVLTVSSQLLERVHTAANVGTAPGTRSKMRKKELCQRGPRPPSDGSSNRARSWRCP